MSFDYESLFNQIDEQSENNAYTQFVEQQSNKTIIEQQKQNDLIELNDLEFNYRDIVEGQVITFNYIRE